MSFILRDYQIEAKDAGVKYLTSQFYKFPGLEILPTGSGKSVIIAAIIKDLKEKVLILQPSKEILVQNFNKYRAYGYYASVYSASLGRKELSTRCSPPLAALLKSQTCSVNSSTS